MSIPLQHLLVLVLVTACASLVGWQAFQSLRGRKSRLGQCCAKGCDAAKVDQPKQPGQRIVFMPVEMLARRK